MPQGATETAQEYLLRQIVELQEEMARPRVYTYTTNAVSTGWQGATVNEARAHPTYPPLYWQGVVRLTAPDPEPTENEYGEISP